MDVFEKKYGFKEDKKIIAFHKGRRMFCIYENKLFIAKPNLPYSHARWFEKEGWISKKQDGLMKSLVRGIVDSKGDIYFYIGYDFKINNKAKSTFFLHLLELMKRLKLKSDSQIFGGYKREGKIWKPLKKYGTIKDNLS